MGASKYAVLLRVLVVKIKVVSAKLAIRHFRPVFGQFPIGNTYAKIRPIGMVELPCVPISRCGAYWYALWSLIGNL